MTLSKLFFLLNYRKMGKCVVESTISWEVEKPGDSDSSAGSSTFIVWKNYIGKNCTAPLRE